MRLLQITETADAITKFGEKWGLGVAVLLLFLGFTGFVLWRSLLYIVRMKDRFDERMREIDQEESKRNNEQTAYLEELVERERDYNTRKDELFAKAVADFTEEVKDLKSIQQRILDKL